MKRRINILSNIDWIVVLLYLLFVIFGWVNIYAAGYSDEYSGIMDLSQRYGKQMMFIFAAFLGNNNNGPGQPVLYFLFLHNIFSFLHNAGGCIAAG